MRKIALVITYLFASFFSFGQIDSADVNLSPYGVIYNHLYFLQDDSYDPNQAAISFPDNIENRNELAIQLIRILDGKGMYVDINRLPTETDYRDSLSQEATYFIDKDEPRIYLNYKTENGIIPERRLPLFQKCFKKFFLLAPALHSFFMVHFGISPYWVLLFLNGWAYCFYLFSVACSFISLILSLADLFLSFFSKN